LRLAEIGHTIGLLPDERYEKVIERAQAIKGLLIKLKERRIGPNHPLNHLLKAHGTSPLTKNGASLYELLRRPQVFLNDLLPLDGIPDDVRSEAEIEVKYAGYLAQQERAIERLRRLEELAIPKDIDYTTLSSLSVEGRELLSRVRPRSFGQATRIPGVSQADLSMFAIYLRR